MSGATTTGVDAGDQPLAGWEQFPEFAMHEVGWQLCDILPVGIRDAPGDGVQRHTAQGPDRSGRIHLPDTAGGCNEVPDGVTLRMLDLQMFPDDLLKFAPQLRREGKIKDESITSFP